MGALLPSHDQHTTDTPAGIPAQRGAPPLEALDPEPTVLHRQRPAAVLGVVAGMAAGAAGTLAAAAIVSAPAVVPAPADDAPRVVPEPRVAFADTGRELTSFGDGTWWVGVDVLPGTYTSAGGPDCRHAFRAAVTGDDIVAGTGSATVVLADGSGFFDTSGCGTWTRTA
jgi:hypothetical protein